MNMGRVVVDLAGTSDHTRARDLEVHHQKPDKQAEDGPLLERKGRPDPGYSAVGPVGHSWMGGRTGPVVTLRVILSTNQATK